MTHPVCVRFGWDGSPRTERKRGGEWGVRISIPAMSFAYGFGWDGSPELSANVVGGARVVTVGDSGASWCRWRCSARIGAIRRAGGLIADLVDDTVRSTPSERMLAQVAAMVAVRRAGVLPGPPRPPVAGPGVDDRPVCVPAAAERWHHVVSSWPVLEDEWMLTLLTNGWRVPPDLVPDMLTRHRSDPIRRARAELACGPLAGWLVGHLPELAARGAAGSAARSVGRRHRRAAGAPDSAGPRAAAARRWRCRCSANSPVRSTRDAGPRPSSSPGQPRRTRATRCRRPGGVGARIDRRRLDRLSARVGARRPRPHPPTHARRTRLPLTVGTLCTKPLASPDSVG